MNDAAEGPGWVTALGPHCDTPPSPSTPPRLTVLSSNCHAPTTFVDEKPALEVAERALAGARRLMAHLLKEAASCADVDPEVEAALCSCVTWT